MPQVTNICQSFTHNMAAKPAGIDMELNYVTVILCVYLFCSEQENSQISVHQTRRNSKAKALIADL